VLGSFTRASPDVIPNHDQVHFVSGTDKIKTNAKKRINLEQEYTAYYGNLNHDVEKDLPRVRGRGAGSDCGVRV
jgi:hypothetical protein